MKGCAQGKALVADATLSFWGEVDAVTGKVIAVGHPLGYQKGRPPVVRVGRVLQSGENGIQTDCPLVGGDFTYASLAEGKESAPGQVTVEQLSRIYEIVNR